MAIVTGISESHGIVRVQIDGRTTLNIRLSTFKKLPVSEGEAIDPEEYSDRVAAAQAKAAYESAIGMIARSNKTEAAIMTALLRKGYVEAAARSATDRLIEQKLLDDRSLAERYVELASTKPIGRYALKQKLRMKGVSDEDAEDALQMLDDEQQSQAALEMARKLSRRYEAEEPRAARAKLSQALARRGFSWSAVSQAVDRIFDNSDEW